MKRNHLGHCMHLANIPKLNPPQVRPCKVCYSHSYVWGMIDFNKPPKESRGYELEPSGTLIAYNRCIECGFVFSPSFDNWSSDEWSQFVYNDIYALIDPGGVDERPRGNAIFLQNLFGASKGDISILDYGCGNGKLAENLVRYGFRDTCNYDPLIPQFSAQPGRKFSVVTCFEVFEHLADPATVAKSICDLVDKEGLIIFSTLLQPSDFEDRGLYWWYVNPRSGHISIFSRDALTRMFRKWGFTIVSINEGLHVAFQSIPHFARHLFA